MTDEAIDRLRQRLRVSGSTLKDCPSDWEGLTWREWEDLVWADWRAAAVKAREGAPVPVLKLATARDRYGWRGLAGGTAYFGGKGE